MCGWNASLQGNWQANKHIGSPPSINRWG